MKTKGLKRQLAAAISMTVVAAVALGTSTYAWFSANNTVQATGMQVQAATEGGIEIACAKSTDSSGNFATVANVGMSSAPRLLPTSTLGTASGSEITSGWYHASAALSSASDAKVDSYETLTLTAGDKDAYVAGSLTENQDASQYYDALGNQYYLVKNFTIRSTSSSALAKGLKVESVSVTPTANTFSDALRVAITVGNKTLFYAPVSDAGIDDVDATTAGKQYKVYSGHTGTGDAAVAVEAGTVTITDNTVATLIGASADEIIPAKGTSNIGGVDVKIYVYFEGEDNYLYSENFNVDTLVLSVDFSATV